jgi:hypothetical protein
LLKRSTTKIEMATNGIQAVGKITLEDEIELFILKTGIAE